MLSNLTLDKLIPLPDEETLAEQYRTELEAEGFPLTNAQKGGVFHFLLRLFARVEIELILLARTMLNESLVSSADKVEWLELRAADYSKTRKPAQKTQGGITLTRENTSSALKIRRGCIFKTDPDSTGAELRFLSVSDVTFETGAPVCTVPIEAELAGAVYNVPAGKITRCLIHLEGVTAISNADGWIVREGSDVEGIESLRSRTLGAFADLATNPTRDKYKSICETVPGVLYVSVDDRHPRGQGTVDIIVTSATGSATGALLDEVRAAALTIAGPYDNLLVKSSETVEQAVSLTLVLPSSYSGDGVAGRAEEAVRSLFAISRGRALNELYVSDLIVAVKSEIPTAKSVRVTVPESDVVLGTGKVIVAGAVSVTVERA